jgi:DNA-binding YbaB/EbfC family protein
MNQSVQEESLMLKELGQLASLMRGAGEITSKMESMSSKLREKRVVGSAGGDMVRVEMNGLAQVTRVTLDPTLVTGGDRELIETLICAATNQASGKAKELHMEVMRELTGGLSLPGLDQLMSGMGSGDAPDAGRTK